MKTRLAWHDLLHRRPRTLAALVGVTFAIVLVFVQSGFYLACRDSAVRIHRLLDFDLLLASERYRFVLESDTFPRARLAQARAVEGVAEAMPIRTQGRLWRNPQTGNRHDLILLGVLPSDQPFAPPELASLVPLLAERDTVLFDRAAHPVLGANPPGTVSELRGHRLTVVGELDWGAGFVGNGLAITSESTFERVFDASPARIELATLRLEQGAEAGAVARALDQRLPDDVRVWTREQIEARDRRFFLRERPIGLMFTSGVVLAILVGGVILFQILASEVTSRRSEFATLRALGYDDRRVVAVVFEQGLLYTLFAFAPATLAAFGLFALTRRVARLPMHLGPGLVLGVFVASLAMGCLGALLATRRLRSADPAELF